MLLEPRSAQWLIPAEPGFETRMKQTVKLLYVRHVDSEGRSLKQDGEIGAITWDALSGAACVLSSQQPASLFLLQLLTIASAETLQPVRKVPRNSHQVSRVGKYLYGADTPPGLP